MSHLFSVSHQPVVGTLGKFPNWHLFWSKLYFSIGKLRATIETLISAQLSIKSIVSSIINISHWQNFTIGFIWCSNFMFNVLPNGKFLLFLFLFGTLAIKAMAFCEISSFAPFCTAIYVLWSNGKFLLFLFLFDTSAIKVMAFWEILLSSHQNLPFLKCVK